MNRDVVIEEIVKKITHLSDAKLEGVYDFVEFLYNRVRDKTNIQQVNDPMVLVPAEDASSYKVSAASMNEVKDETDFVDKEKIKEHLESIYVNHEIVNVSNESLQNLASENESITATNFDDGNTTITNDTTSKDETIEGFNFFQDEEAL
jgi:hypothetical protein